MDKNLLFNVFCTVSVEAVKIIIVDNVLGLHLPLVQVDSPPIAVPCNTTVVATGLLVLCVDIGEFNATIPGIAHRRANERRNIG